MIFILLLSLSASLRNEVAGFMQEYGFQGYTIQWSRGLYLQLDQPREIWVPVPGNLQGVFCGVGGDKVLNLHMELSTPEGNITDEYPDDLPVLSFETGDIEELVRVTVTAEDILFGELSDSVYVFFAMGEKPLEEEISDSAEPDST